MSRTRYLILRLALYLFSINILAGTVLEGDALSQPRRLQSRKLSAASRVSNLQARSDGFGLSNDVEFIYVEGLCSILIFFPALTMQQETKMASNHQQSRPQFALGRTNRSLFWKKSSIYYTT